MDAGITGLTFFRSMDCILILQMDTASRTYPGADSTAYTFISYLKSCPYCFRRIFYHLGIYFMDCFFCNSCLLNSSPFFPYISPDLRQMFFHLLILRHLLVHIKCRKEIIHHFNRGNIICLLSHALKKRISNFRRPSMMRAISQDKKQVLCPKRCPANKFLHHTRHFMPIDRTYDTNAV